MATLKICTPDRSHWITEVRCISELNTFGIPEGGDVDIVQLAYKDCPGGPLPGFNMVDFTGQNVGKLLSVQRERSEVEHWLVPASSCFLMADTGKTIDRF